MTVTVTLEFNLDLMTMNHHAKHLGLGRRSFRSKVIVHTHRHTHIHRLIALLGR